MVDEKLITQLHSPHSFISFSQTTRTINCSVDPGASSSTNSFPFDLKVKDLINMYKWAKYLTTVNEKYLVIMIVTGTNLVSRLRSVDMYTNHCLWT